ncbi:hypothetical protein ES703_86628 [subsurface metagenome]
MRGGNLKAFAIPRDAGGEVVDIQLEGLILVPGIR